MAELLGRLAHSARFQGFVTAVILFAAVLVGLETSPELVSRFGGLLHALDRVVLGVFVLELVIKIGAEGRRPWRFFLDPWNVFDFVIVAVVFLPIQGNYVTVLRLVRLLRVLRLIHAVPRLQILVSALLKSVPSMGYVSLLLLLVFYVYGVAAVFLFGQNDPFRFGNLPRALVTLFQVATAEDWSTTLYTQMYGCAAHGYDGREAACVASSAKPLLAPVYFISFILIGTMVILNLFIGVIMNSMQEAQAETEGRAELQRIREGAEADPLAALEDELAVLEHRLSELQASVRAVAAHARARASVTSSLPRS
jgi:voltage-gated sodium channel